MHPFTILYLHYNNPEAIAYLESVGARQWEVPIVVVDDGSAVPLALDWPNTTVVRIDEDVPWNMSAANNVGLRYVQTDAVLRLDIDHFFDTADFGRLSELAAKLPDETMYLFPRRNVGSDAPLRAAPNLYLTHTELLRSVGGYDERFCGHYGYEDVELRKRLRRRGVAFETLEAPFCYRKGSLMTQGLDRSTERNKALYDDIMAGRLGGWTGQAG